MSTFIEQFRLELNLSQMEIANYLEIKRSTFAMAERKERDLPHDQYIWLTTLISNKVQEEELPPAKEFIAEYLQAKEILKKRRDENNYQLQNCERKQTELYQTARAYQKQLATLNKVYYSNAVSTTNQQQWLREQITSLETIYLPLLAKEIKILEVRIQGLKAELLELGN